MRMLLSSDAWTSLQLGGPEARKLLGPCRGDPQKRFGMLALAGVAQWIECPPANQRVTGLIPSQGTCLGCQTGPQ